MSSAEDPPQLHLPYHNLHKIDCNQARLSPSSVNPNPNFPAQKNPSHSRDELQLLHQMKLPLKLPQRRKFITLAEANSASFGLNFHVNLDKFASLGSSAFQKALDLAMVEGHEEASKQVELPAMAESKEEALYEAAETTNTKKKLLAQLAESPGATVDSEKIESRFHRSSNPSRTCRFCAREFPSGRALGGHMRVHGALLFADNSPYIAEQERRNHGELETLGSVDQTDPHLSRRKVEEVKPSSFTSSSNSSQMNSERIKLDPNGQENNEEEEEQEQGEGEKVTRMVNLSSFECTSLVNKELLGYGDSSSELLTGKRKPASALYELRRNPKPNQRFFRDQERRSLSNAILHSSSAAGTAPRSRSPSPEHERACSECGKIFFSWKALFGHMRCHPERDWRGIQPPERSFELDRTLDRTLRSITPKASYAEISSAENTTNCELAASVLSHVDNKGKITAKLQQDASLKNKVLDALTAAAVVPKETESSLTQKGGVCLDTEPRDAAMNIEQGEDNITQRPASKKAECTSKKNSTKIPAEHVDYPASKEVTKAWSPSWRTGKRSKRNRSVPSHYELSLTTETTSNEIRLSQHDAQLDVQEDLDMANCLVLLSNAGDNIQEIERMCRDHTEGSAFSHHVKKRRVSPKAIYSQRPSRAGMGAIQAHVEDDDDDDAYDEVENKVATFSVGVEAEKQGIFNTEVKYQCSTCKKCFNSHQALGGHRASHKKMKGCFAQTKNFAKEAQESSEENDTEDDFGIKHIRWQAMAHGEGQQEEERPDVFVDPILKVSPKKKIKGHECSICHRIFASGQALGGHKRCHWNGERYVADTASVASSNIKQPSLEEKSEWGSKGNGIKQLAKEDAIDLNLPAPLDEDEEATFDSLQTQGAGGLLPKAAKEEQTISSVMDYLGARRRQNNVQEDWIVKDLLGVGSGSSNFLRENREIEARCRFDRRPPLGSRKWDNVVSTQIPQVCSLKTI